MPLRMMVVVAMLMLVSQSEASVSDCHGQSFINGCRYLATKEMVYCCKGKNVTTQLENIYANEIMFTNADLSEKDLESLTLSPQVKRLSISHCSGIETIRKFKTNNYLIELELKSCNIKAIEPGAFDNLTSLTSLNLENNNIMDVKIGQFNNIPVLEKLYLLYNKFATIPSNLFNKANRITDLDFTLTQVKTIWNDTFGNLTRLQSLHLEGCKITTISSGAFDRLPKLHLLNLRRNLLKQFPIFRVRNNNLHKLYLDNNMIKELKSDHLTNIPSLSILTLERNDYETIPNNFFKKSNTITKLNFSNTPIRTIEQNAFVNLERLVNLTLDGTDIETFPTKGLTNLRHLSLKNVKRLFSIPSYLTKVEKIEVSPDRSFLCCKFYLESYEDGRRPMTNNMINTTATPTDYATTTTTPTTTTPPPNVTNTTTTTPFTIPTGFGKRGKRFVVITAGPFNSSIPFITSKPRDVICIPGPNEFQPCENIMGADWLTIVSFIVAPFALCGNFIVIVVFLCVGRDYNVARFLVTNLAIADMCLGVYLMSLVVESVITSGEYYNHVKEFQYGTSCNVLGFLAMFASTLSVYSLTMITVERYLTIVYALYPKQRLKMRHAAILMLFGWLISITVAVLPIVGVSSYSKVAICLPFEVDDGGEYYLIFVFCFNAVSFVFIAVMYFRIYRTVFLPNNSTPTRGDERVVARRMAILVLTDFACFAPIAMAALSAMFGNTLISVAQSKYLLVFFFPLNSFMNPLLYALITKSFRRDLAAILKNCLVCGETLTGYLSTSLPSRVQSHNDFLGTRHSFDFNTIDCNGSANTVQCQSNNSLAVVSYASAHPNLVKFQNLENRETPRVRSSTVS